MLNKCEYVKQLIINYDIDNQYNLIKINLIIIML